MSKKETKKDNVATVRVVRSKDQIVEELESKISYHKDCIKKLESKKNNVLNSKPRKKRVGLNSIISKAKESGLSAEEIAKKLGITIE